MYQHICMYVYIDIYVYMYVCIYIYIYMMLISKKTILAEKMAGLEAWSLGSLGRGWTGDVPGSLGVSWPNFVGCVLDAAFSEIHRELFEEQKTCGDLIRFW